MGLNFFVPVASSQRTTNARVLIVARRGRERRAQKPGAGPMTVLAALLGVSAGLVGTKLPVELLGEVHRGLNLGETDRDALTVDPERNPIRRQYPISSPAAPSDCWYDV